jgi:glycosyltransferase involved in cell wall biosynthesis
MTGGLRVLSLYEGFFAGGARILHSGVVAGLHAGGGQTHSVLSIHRRMFRETIVQRMEDDACYRLLLDAGVRVRSLRRDLGGAPGQAAGQAAFGPAEVAAAARHAARADVVLSLKEQPLRLVNQPGFPRRPVVVCLHRSDPENQGSALAELATAVADGRVVAAVCCAESTRAAYEAAGIPGYVLSTIPNGVDLTRFRPAPPRERAGLRRSLGLPSRAAVVAFAARYDAMKNVPLFLRAAREFLSRERTGYVVMCGAGMSPHNPLLSDDIDAAFAGAGRLRRRLRLLGLHGDMRAVYASADVVSLTSGFGEAAPLCLIEGAMCGAVPVATDVGDCASIVAGQGLLTAADPAAIAASWIEALDRRAEFAPALAASRERFSQTRMIAAYAALIGRVHQRPEPVLAR